MKSNTMSITISVLGGEKTAIQVLWIATFTALTAFGAKLELPHQPVPYTVQTFFVLLSGAFLGKRNGMMSQLLYLAIGAVGAPVFSGSGAGFARLLGPTGGYLLSFPVASFVVGYLVQEYCNLLWVLLSMTVGMFIVFSLGTLHLEFVYVHDWADAVRNGFLIFSWWDLLKLSGAAVLYHRIRTVRDSKVSQRRG